MKKILVLMLAFVMAFSFAACGGSDEGEPQENTDTVQVDEGLVNVDITLPASMFEGETDQEIIANAEESGYKCVVNEDGSVVYTMSKKQQKEMLAEMKTSLDAEIQNYVSGEEAIECYDAIKYNDDLTAITIEVNDKYGSADEGFTVFGLLITSSYYQMFAGVAEDDIDCVITYVDSATGEELDSISLKELSEDSE